MTTLAPSSTKRSAVALPMPAAPPVMSATLSLKTHDSVPPLLSIYLCIGAKDESFVIVLSPAARRPRPRHSRCPRATMTIRSPSLRRPCSSPSTMSTASRPAAPRWPCRTGRPTALRAAQALEHVQVGRVLHVQHVQDSPIVRRRVLSRSCAAPRQCSASSCPSRRR